MDDSPKLRDYQVADLAYYIANPKSMNLSEPGTGKTPSVVVYQYYLWKHLGVGSAWVQPKRLLDKNRREILRFTDFTEEDVVILDGTPKQIQKQLESGAKVFLMSFRRWTLSWEKLPSYVTAVQVDEYHKGFKTPDSENCRSLTRAFTKGRMKYFLPMTGTLISGRLSSAFSAINIIEPRYYSSFRAFMYQHTITDFNGKVIGWKNHEKLGRIFGAHAIRRTFKDVYGEQEVVYLTEVVKMGDRQRKMYDQFHREAVLELENFFLNGTQPGVAFIRARQLMEHPNHFPNLADPDSKTFIDIMPGETPGKEDLLDIHLEDHVNTGRPLIIFSALVPQQQRIIKMLDDRKMSYGVINGSTSRAAGDKAARDFEDGNIQVIVCSPICADIGFNFQFSGKWEVDHVMFLSSDYLDTTFIQAVQRAIRGKRSSPLRVTVMEYEDSLDQHIFSIIYRKSLDANKVDSTRPIIQLSKYEKEYSS